MLIVCAQIVSLSFSHVAIIVTINSVIHYLKII